MIEDEKLKTGLMQIAECHLPDAMKSLNKQLGERWACQCGAPYISTKEQYLNHLAEMQMTVIRRFATRP